MKILSAEFIKSATRPAHYPPPALPEIAFAGRSNVGKSSLVNRLVNQKKLVKTSQTPGRTQLVNFFEINRAFSFVDLPGFGYAKVSKSVQQSWRAMVESYFKARNSLKGVVLIVDARRGPEEEETDLAAWLGILGVPVIWVATKADKLSGNTLAVQLTKIAAALSVSRETVIPFSAKTGKGREAVWSAIGALCGKEPAPQPAADAPNTEEHG
jgi:GTP-binding protein